MEKTFNAAPDPPVGSGFARDIPGSQAPDVDVQVRPSLPVQVVILPTVLQVPP